MKKSIKKSNCPKCNSKNAIETVVKLTDEYVKVKVGKCQNCGHSPGIKELSDNESKTNP